jgi:hypothetical protein
MKTVVPALVLAMVLVGCGRPTQATVDDELVLFESSSKSTFEAALTGTTKDVDDATYLLKYDWREYREHKSLGAQVPVELIAGMDEDLRGLEAAISAAPATRARAANKVNRWLGELLGHYRGELEHVGQANYLSRELLLDAREPAMDLAKGHVEALVTEWDALAMDAAQRDRLSAAADGSDAAALEPLARDAIERCEAVEQQLAK